MAVCAGWRTKEGAAVKIGVWRAHLFGVVPIENDVSRQRDRREAKGKIDPDQRTPVLELVADPFDGIGARPSASASRAFFQNRRRTTRIGHRDLQSFLPRSLVTRPIDTHETVKCRH